MSNPEHNHDDPDGCWACTPDDELRQMTDGCTELTCIYHGEINRELHRRKSDAKHDET